MRLVPKDGHERKDSFNGVCTAMNFLSLSLFLLGFGVLLGKNDEREGKVQTISK